MADFGRPVFGYKYRSWTQVKDLAEVDYWGVDWSGKWLGAELITNAVWVIPVDSGLTVTNDHIAVNGYVTNNQFADGNIGVWEIEITITTDGARIRTEKFLLRVEEL